jgi:hypothetical protein
MAVISGRQVPFDPSILTPEYLSYDNKGEILSITGTFTAIAFVVVLARIYVRAFMLRVFGPDDYIIVLSMVYIFNDQASL